ncbi:MAG: oligoendopeptidase F family protein, partial [Clostridiales bacterium]|nr:oligoendopeptidase F family protein [Clostridiales bacterium]
MTKGNNLPKRSEVKEEHKWAVEDLYTTDKLWEEEYDQLRSMLTRATEYRGRLSESAKVLLEFLKLSD